MPPLRELLLDCLWQAFMGPVLFWPLIQEDVAVQHIAALSLAGSGTPGGVEAARAVQRGCVGPLCSLYVFERLFLAITDQELLVQLLCGLLGGSAAGGSSSSSPCSSRPGSPEQLRQAATAAATTAAAPHKWHLPPALLFKLQYSPAAYRQALLGMLRGTDAQSAAAAVRVLAALLQSHAVGEEELELVGLLPLRRRKQRQLLQALVGESPASSLLLDVAPGAAAVAPAAGAQQKGDTNSPVPAEPLQQGSSPAAQADGSMAACNGTAKPAFDGSQEGSLGSKAADQVHLRLNPAADGSMAVQLQCRPEQHQPADQQPPAAQHPRGQQQQVQQRALGAALAEQRFDDIVGALLGLLGSELLPPLSLHTVGWLLNKLLSVGKGGAQLSNSQHAALSAAVARQQAALQQQLQGQWCDALAPMAAAEWQRCRQAILHAGPGSVHVAVQTWMQVRCRLAVCCWLVVGMALCGGSCCTCALLSACSPIFDCTDGAGARAPVAAGRGGRRVGRTRPSGSSSQAGVPDGARCGGYPPAAAGRC